MILPMLVAPPAACQVVRDLPQQLEGVSVTERAGEWLPLDLEFVDETGRGVRLGQYFAGERPVILVLGYYKCPMLCGLVHSGLVQSLGELSWTVGEQFDVVSVSINPLETPSLAALKKQSYVEEYGRAESAAGWHFLTGREADIRALADAVGFGYRWIEERGEYAHQAVIFVASPRGKLTRYLYGVRFDPSTVKLSLIEAAEGKIGSPLDRVVLFCFHYDAAEGRYTVAVMNLLRAGGGLTVVALGLFLATFWLRERGLRRRPTEGPAR
ncbi:MAG: SCO family protein [Acidobacteriota bacterium]|nr:MAG: SCO family protein [Acidobacteriota bacterium]